MIVGVVRNGLVETVHPVAVAVVDSGGGTQLTSGDAHDREFFLRSAIKPFQATVSQRLGAALGLEQLAVAAASHQGQPAHVALVEQMLLEVGLEAGHLRCPPDWPGDTDAERLWAERGRGCQEAVFHNCSGKHAAMLRACVARDWSLDYVAPDHPLQQEILTVVSAATGRPAGPVGVDGCGAPTLRSDVAGLARAFAVLATAPEFSGVRTAAMRFASLTRDGDRPETEIARWLPTVVKGGAAGCIGIAWPEVGLGIAAKAWSGEATAAVLGALVALAELGVVPEHPRRMLEPHYAPPVLGGGMPVGRWEVIER